MIFTNSGPEPGGTSLADGLYPGGGFLPSSRRRGQFVVLSQVESSFAGSALLGEVQVVVFQGDVFAGLDVDGGGTGFLSGFVAYALDIVAGNGGCVGCGDEDGRVVGAIDSVVFDGDVAEYAGQGRVFPAGGDAFDGNDAARHGRAVVAMFEGIVAYGHVSCWDAFVEMYRLGDDQDARGGDVFECAVLNDGVADLDEHAASAVPLEGTV